MRVIQKQLISRLAYTARFHWDDDLGESFSQSAVIEYMEPNDEILWLAVQKGDRKAFAALFDRHAAALFRFASRLLSDARDAEDAVQEVLLSLLQGNGFNPSRGTLRPYLFGAVRNQARKRGREPCEKLPEHVATPERSPTRESKQGWLQNVTAAHALLGEVTEAIGVMPYKHRGKHFKTLHPCRLSRCYSSQGGPILLRRTG